MKATTETTSVFLSIDCFLSDLKLTIFANSPFILKVFLSSLTPIIFVMGIVLFYMVTKLCFRQPIKRKIITCVTTLLFFFYPTITLMNLGLFNCIEFNGEQYLAKDLAVLCWKGTHLLWVIFLGLPMIAIWIIGLPVLGILILLKNKKKLRTSEIRSQYRILYLGLRDKTFYWESVNTARKLILLFINVFVKDSMYKALFCSGALIVIYFV